MTRQRLNRVRIIDTAIQMADEDGLSSVTLRRIAARLGVHVTSLYNHVPTKEAVLDEMIARLVAEADLPTGAIAWEAWVRQFAAAMRDVARKHPGAFGAFHHGPVQGPQAALVFEAALASFRSGGFDVASAYCAVKATAVAVLGAVLEDMVPSRSRGRRTDLSGLPPEPFPHLQEANVIAAEADSFSYLIDALVEGFAATLRKTQSGASPRDR
jgi:AcrR family transcriptional regulator